MATTLRIVLSKMSEDIRRFQPRDSHFLLYLTLRIEQLVGEAVGLHIKRGIFEKHLPGRIIELLATTVL